MALGTIQAVVDHTVAESILDKGTKTRQDGLSAAIIIRVWRLQAVDQLEVLVAGMEVNQLPLRLQAPWVVKGLPHKARVIKEGMVRTQYRLKHPVETVDTELTIHIRKMADMAQEDLMDLDQVRTRCQLKLLADMDRETVDSSTGLMIRIRKMVDTVPEDLMITQAAMVVDTVRIRVASHRLSVLGMVLEYLPKRALRHPLQPLQALPARLRLHHPAEAVPALQLAQAHPSPISPHRHQPGPTRHLSNLEQPRHNQAME